MRRTLSIGVLGIALGFSAANAYALSFPADITTSVVGDGIKARALLTPPAPTVANTLTLRVEATTREGVSLEWPASLVAGGELGGMTIAAVRDLPSRIDTEGMLVTAREFEIEPFLPGDAELGPFEFAVQREGAPSDTLMLPALKITIRPLLEENAPAEFIGPKGIVDAPEEAAQDLTLLIAGGSAAVVLCIAAGTLIALRRRGQVSAESPSRRALAALAVLEAAVRGEGNVGQRPTNERAYTDLSSILRTYIEGRFEYRATARTTEEFLRDASDNRTGGLPSDAAEKLGVVLGACDEVKFAGAEPGMAAAGRAIDEVRAFVETFGDADEEGAA